MVMGRRFIDEPFWMYRLSCEQCLKTRQLDFFSQSVMDAMRSMQPDPGLVMGVVVPLEEEAAETASVLE